MNYWNLSENFRFLCFSKLFVSLLLQIEDIVASILYLFCYLLHQMVSEKALSQLMANQGNGSNFSNNVACKEKALSRAEFLAYQHEFQQAQCKMQQEMLCKLCKLRDTIVGLIGNTFSFAVLTSF